MEIAWGKFTSPIFRANLSCFSWSKFCDRSNETQLLNTQQYLVWRIGCKKPYNGLDVYQRTLYCLIVVFCIVIWQLGRSENKLKLYVLIDKTIGKHVLLRD